MRIVVRKLISRLVNTKTRRSLKSFETQWRRRLQSIAPPLDDRAFRDLFAGPLGVRNGDIVMVHASLSLVPTDLNGDQVLEILRECVGPQGTVVVPTFPRMSSAAYLVTAAPFDAQRTPSGMGSLSEAVRRSPGAFRSTHPTKSVAAIGPHAQEICFGHERCVYPFGAGSPYERMLELGVRIIGIGAPMSYLSFVHVAEDLEPEKIGRPVWDPHLYEKTCFDMEGREHRVRTKIHNMDLMPKANPEQYCRRRLDRVHYVIVRKSMADFFAVDGRALTDALRADWSRNLTIYD